MTSWMTHLGLVLSLISANAVAQGVPSSVQQNNNSLIINVPTPNAATKFLSPSLVSYGPAKNFMMKSLDWDLTLMNTYQYNFTINLKARDSKASPAKVPDGWYYITVTAFAQEAESYDGSTPIENRFITTNSPVFGEVRGGTFNADIPLTFKDIAQTAIQSDLYIELIPLKKMCGKDNCVKFNGDGSPDLAQSKLELLPGFAPFLAVMDFLPFKKTDSPKAKLLTSAVNPFQGKTLQLYSWQLSNRREIERLNAKAKAMPAEVFALSQGIRPISIHDKALAQASKVAFKGDASAAENAIRSILSSPSLGTITLPGDQSRLARTFCETLATYNEQTKLANRAWYDYFSSEDPSTTLAFINACAYHPEKYFRLSRVTHVGSIDPQNRPTILSNGKIGYSLMINSIKGRSRSWDVSTSTGVSIGASTSASKYSKLFSLIDVSVSADVSRRVGRTDTTNKIDQGVSSAREDLVFLPMAFSIPTLKSKNCLQVSYIVEAASPFYDSRSGALNGLYICDDVRPRMNVQEVYAHMYSFGEDSSLTSAFAPGTQSINRSLRGETQISALFWRIRSAITADHNSLIYPSTFSQSAETYFSKTPSISTLRVVTPIAFEKETNPSIASMFFLGGNNQAFMDDN